MEVIGQGKGKKKDTNGKEKELKKERVIKREMKVKGQETK